MLIFNPEQRISSYEALKDSYFDEVRIEEQEEEIGNLIDLSFIDKYQEGELKMGELKIMIEKTI